MTVAWGFQDFRASKINGSQMKTRIGLAIASLGLLFEASAISQDTDRQQSNTKVASSMPEKVLLKKLLGKWEGSCRTWFEPNKLADESKVSGEVALSPSHPPLMRMRRATSAYPKSKMDEAGNAPVGIEK